MRKRVDDFGNKSLVSLNNEQGISESQGLSGALLWEGTRMEQVRLRAYRRGRYENMTQPWAGATGFLLLQHWTWSTSDVFDMCWCFDILENARILYSSHWLAWKGIGLSCRILGKDI